jgi:hypothetical protein
MGRYLTWTSIAWAGLLLGAPALLATPATGRPTGDPPRPAMVSGPTARPLARLVALAGQPGRVVVNRLVRVGPGGGSAQVRFKGRAGQRLYISLRASKPRMEPYGHLEYGNQARYFPTNRGARQGYNIGALDLGYSGRYTLTIFDGSNRGGLVRVLVSLVSPSGGPAPPPSAAGRLLVNRTLNVAGGGGGTSLKFTVRAGRRVRITLRSDTPQVRPYGHLSHSRWEAYFPLNSTARPGYNQGVTLLRHGGSYTLTVYDGSNQGGRVNVKVVALP